MKCVDLFYGVFRVSARAIRFSIARTAPLQEKQTPPKRRNTDGLLTTKQLSRESDR